VILLAGDIGATHSRLSIFDARGPKLVLLRKESFPSKEYRGIQEILARFLSGHPERPEYACLGVPGPVTGGRSVTTNLPWAVDGEEILSMPGFRKVWLLNDLEAIAHGLSALDPGDLHSMTSFSVVAGGNRAVIAPGSGLGEAGLHWDGDRYRPFASEGGHCGFAPSDPEQIELLQYLAAMFQNVSWERVLSGPGIVHIYSFLRDSGRGIEPDWLKARFESGDPAALIAEAALEGRSPLCERTLELFFDLLASEAANLCLKLMAVGGIYIAGGIVPKILPKLDRDRFMRSFLNKGRLAKVLETFPLHIVLNDEVGMRGAALFARGNALLMQKGEQGTLRGKSA
jgi:glucokinase